ncbi:MAG: hypothetical protein IJW78_03575 [Clostridia bacterium]|nr:hypothetical protein [Clostridia bacterium]
MNFHQNKVTRKDLATYDMVHNNPGLEPYESNYNSDVFLKERGYNGHVFELFQCAQYGITWDSFDERIFPEDSAERDWILAKQAELKEKYQAAKAQDLEVMFMMDTVVVPKRVKELYPEICNADGKIDIQKPKTKEIMDRLFDEMFATFPEIDGIYIRFGETYVGERFHTPYHVGNNPILEDAEQYHIFLIQYLQNKICKEHNKKLFYRSWGFGEFQYDPEYYLKISNAIDVHEKFYFCIKHTEGDFHRTFPFNQCLNVGKHQQIVEVQAAREYEGKGAYPNYIGDGVINGYEEFQWLMKPDAPQCLRDCINVPDSKVTGIWTWSRGGGWDGPFLDGKDYELWADVNAYVITHWAKDTARSDKYYALQYAKEVLSMSQKDAEIFYEILLLSAKAVLLGRGTNTDAFAWDVFWTRDQNIEYSRILGNIQRAALAGQIDLLLDEKKRSVEIWSYMVQLAERLSDSVEKKPYIVTTCTYGLYLYRLYECIYRANAYAMQGGLKAEVEQAVSQYDATWKAWEELYKTAPHCPTLYAKRDELLDLIGYNWNKGLDAAINPLRVLDEDGKILPENREQVLMESGWGLTGGEVE